jgi:hypothetical protein
VQEILKHETHCAGSDAILHGKSTHPRVSGCEAREARRHAKSARCSARCSLPSLNCALRGLALT